MHLSDYFHKSQALPPEYLRLGILEESIIKPLPEEQGLLNCEALMHADFPVSYRHFVAALGGCQIKASRFGEHARYEIERFFWIVNHPEVHPLGEWDLLSANALLEEAERNIFEPGRLQVQCLPIAKLTYGDYLCLDYYHSPSAPPVVFLNFEESCLGAPSITKIADSFEEFLSMLHE